jgi:hypothetical protein
VHRAVVARLELEALEQLLVKGFAGQGASLIRGVVRLGNAGPTIRSSA